MSNRAGDFIWYELMTSDADGAQAFYGGLVGWDFRAADQGVMDYRQFGMNGTVIGGCLPITEEMTQGGARPLWAGYIAVQDVDVSAEAVKRSGGEILLPPYDIPDVGRIAFIADPQGAPLYVMRPATGEHVSESFSTHLPREGHCAWNELATSDPQAAKSFYGDVFGWETADTMNLGPLGDYDILRNGADRDFTFGAVMQKPEEVPVSLWSFYFRVAGIDDAVRFIEMHGGQVLNGPLEIPGGDFALNALDPQGANFSLVGKR